MRRLGVRAALVGGELVRGDVGVEGDTIVAVGSAGQGSGVAVPGFVDLQVNGFAGFDFGEADPDGIRAAAEALVAHGTTTFQPTDLREYSGDGAPGRRRRRACPPACWRPVNGHSCRRAESASRLTTHPSIPVVRPAAAAGRSPAPPAPAAGPH